MNRSSYSNLHMRKGPSRRVRASEQLSAQAPKDRLDDAAEAHVDSSVFMQLLAEVGWIQRLQWVVIALLAVREFNLAPVVSSRIAAIVAVFGWQAPAAIVLAMIVAIGIYSGVLELEPLDGDNGREREHSRP